MTAVLCPPPFPHAGKRMTEPEGSGSIGVLVLGEAPSDMENAVGTPFVKNAPAGSVLSRAIRKCGYDREQFVLYDTVPMQPPKLRGVNHDYWLEGAPYESAAIEWGRPYLEQVIREYSPRCILALGNIPLKATTGACGDYRSISHLRGYVLPGRGNIPVVGSFHPSFLRRGAMPLLSVLMHDIKLAVAVAGGQETRFFSPVLWRDFVYEPQPLPNLTEPTVPAGYVTHPSEQQAWEFLEQARSAELIAYDIETPRSAATSEDESDELADTEILSIQFSLAPGTGIFMPWREPFVEVARRVLGLPVPKVGANTWRFDDPLLTAHGAPVNGIRHDVRWMWHTLQPDLRGALQFIASFYPYPGLPHVPWKMLHQSHPSYYGIMDCDCLQRIMA